MANVTIVDFDHAVEFVHMNLKQLFFFSRARSFEANGIWTLAAASGAFTVEVDMASGSITITKAMPPASVMVGAIPAKTEMDFDEWTSYFHRVLVNISDRREEARRGMAERADRMSARMAKVSGESETDDWIDGNII